LRLDLETQELRTLAEKELEALSMQNRPRQPRQDEDGGEEETTDEPGIIPQVSKLGFNFFRL